MFQREDPTTKKCDVVIVGGGISGLYCAMKLMEHSDLLEERGVKSILIMEKSDRWGGRLDTDIVKVESSDEGKKIIKEEEGAMRFTYHRDPESSPKSNMPLLSDLIRDLQFEDEVLPFFMEPQAKNPPHTKTVPNCNSRYFDAQHFTDWYANQNPTMWKNLFNLERQEEFKSAGEIVKDIYRKLLDHNRYNLLAHFPKEKAEVIIAQQNNDLLQEYENTDYWEFFRNQFTWTVGMQELPLRDFSMQALLTSMGYSHGCCMMMVQTQGFLCVSLSEGNVGSIMQDLITFNLIWDKLFQFKRGWTSLVNKLIDHIKETSKKLGIHLEMQKNSEVMMLKSDKSAGFKVMVEEGLKGTDTVTIAAKNVVMALPPKAVEDIINKSKYYEMADTDIMKICRSVEGIHCTKINLYFDDDWWNQDCDTMMFGPNMTSLPCGFIYPFYGECKVSGCKGCEKCEDDEACPAALTIYCDINNAQFWSSLQRLGHKFQSPLQDKKKELLPASEPVVLEALNQFRKVFNIENIPHPILTSYRSWDGEDEYGYAIHMWGLGVDDRKITKKVAKPLEEKNLFFCNEAWSGYQGWVEGSLMSTQNAVKKMLDLDD